jgi:general secretion pathway protein J
MSVTTNKGFTLVEVLVASTISTFIALVAVGALKAVVDSSHAVHQITETSAEVRFAARMLAHDLANLYRDPDPKSMKFVGVSQGADTSSPAYLTFYTVGRSKARADQAEGDVYEVEYMLASRQDEELPAEPGEESMVLFRRLWPNPDKDRSPGGVLTTIAENISVFHIRFFDGEQWGSEWSEEMESIPQLVEVTVAARPPGRADPIIETTTVSFARLAESSAGSSGEGEGSETESEPQEPAGESAPAEDSGSNNRGSPNASGR